MNHPFQGRPSRSTALARSFLAAAFAVLLVALMVVITGCSVSTSSISASDPLIRGRWQLAEAHDAAGAFDLSESWITLDIATTTNGSGLTPCNNYGVTVIGGRGAVFVTQTFSTRQVCVDDALNELERRYLGALVSATRATVTDGRVEFSSADARLIFRPREELTDTELLNRLWNLESLIVWAGTEPTLSPATGEGSLLVNGNGGFRGATGCRDFDGRYEVRGGEIAITRFSKSISVCTPPFKWQDVHVSIVLTDGVRAEVLGDLLILRNDTQGVGLVYRADR